MGTGYRRARVRSGSGRRSSGFSSARTVEEPMGVARVTLPMHYAKWIQHRWTAICVALQRGGSGALRRLIGPRVIHRSWADSAKSAQWGVIRNGPKGFESLDHPGNAEENQTTDRQEQPSTATPRSVGSYLDSLVALLVVDHNAPQGIATATAKSQSMKSSWPAIMP